MSSPYIFKISDPDDGRRLSVQHVGRSKHGPQEEFMVMLLDGEECLAAELMPTEAILWRLEENPFVLPGHEFDIYDKAANLISIYVRYTESRVAREGELIAMLIEQANHLMKVSVAKGNFFRKWLYGGDGTPGDVSAEALEEIGVLVIQGVDNRVAFRRLTAKHYGL